MVKIFKIRDLILFQIAIFGGLLAFASAANLHASEASQRQDEPGVVQFDLSNQQAFAATAFTSLILVGWMFLSTIQRADSWVDPNLPSKPTQGKSVVSNMTAFKDATIEGLGIQNKRSRRCIDIPQGNTGDNAPTDIWDCASELREHEKFNLKFTGKTVKDGPWDAPTFRIIAKHSNKCMDVNAGSSYDNTAVIQLACIPGANYQEWYLRWVPQLEVGNIWDFILGNNFANIGFLKGDHGYFQIVGVGSGKCLTVSEGWTDNGVPLNIYKCIDEHESTNQLWKFL